MIYLKIIKTPIGELTLISAQGKITSIYFEGREDEEILKAATKSKDPLLEETAGQIKNYFNYKLVEFKLPLNPLGTSFQRKVWKVLTQIPYGRTISYGEQAQMLGDSKKARAVGGANGKNPIPLVIPCHRVIGKSGDLTGFGGGIKIKKFLLDFEASNPLKKLSKPHIQMTL